MPKGTPKPILAKLENWFNAFVSSEEGKRFLTEFKWDAFPGNAQMLKDILIKETKLWGDYVKIAKMESK